MATVQRVASGVMAGRARTERQALGKDGYGSVTENGECVMGRKAHSRAHVLRRPQASKRTRQVGVGIDGISTDLLTRYSAAQERDHEGVWR